MVEVIHEGAAIVGRNRAVADFTTPNTTLTGWFAWLSWMMVHLTLLISYRNRVRTLRNWLTAFLTKRSRRES